MPLSPRRLVASLVPGRWKRPLKQAMGLPLTRMHEDWSILAPIGPVDAKHVVLDIGAHHGWFFHCWQDWCPGARVIAFEPFAESYDVMHALYGSDPRVRLVQAAVGSSPGQMELQVFEESKVSNSLLQPRESAWRDIDYRHGAIRPVPVPVTTISDVFAGEQLESVYLAKVDVQGYELEVLKGAGEFLSRIDHIFVEAGIQRLYEGAPRFSEVFEFLADRGFHLMAMRSWHRGNRVLVETDMLFRRNDLADPIDPEVARVYEENG